MALVLTPVLDEDQDEDEIRSFAFVLTGPLRLKTLAFIYMGSAKNYVKNLSVTINGVVTADHPSPQSAFTRTQSIAATGIVEHRLEILMESFLPNGVYIPDSKTMRVDIRFKSPVSNIRLVGEHASPDEKTAMRVIGKQTTLVIV